MTERRGGPLRRAPQARDDERRHHQHLSNEQFGRCHEALRRGAGRGGWSHRPATRVGDTAARAQVDAACGSWSSPMAITSVAAPHRTRSPRQTHASPWRRWAQHKEQQNTVKAYEQNVTHGAARAVVPPARPSAVEPASDAPRGRCTIPPTRAGEVAVAFEKGLEHEEDEVCHALRPASAGARCYEDGARAHRAVRRDRDRMSVSAGSQVRVEGLLAIVEPKD